MLSWLVRRQIDAFERRWSYDMRYAREVLAEAGLGALLPMNALAKLSAYRGGVPPEAYYGAKIVAAILADCGPCAQLVVTEAERDGLDAAIVRALVRGELGALPEAAKLGADLARGAVLRDGSGEEARQEILARWGRRGLTSLAYAIVAAQAFPTLKYALGHGHGCIRVQVAGFDVTPRAVQSSSAIQGSIR
jgi:hypothetical protein